MLGWRVWAIGHPGGWGAAGAMSRTAALPTRRCRRDKELSDADATSPSPVIRARQARGHLRRAARCVVCPAIAPLLLAVALALVACSRDPLESITLDVSTEWVGSPAQRVVQVHFSKLRRQIRPWTRPQRCRPSRGDATRSPNPMRAFGPPQRGSACVPSGGTSTPGVCSGVFETLDPEPVSLRDTRSRHQPRRPAVRLPV